MTAKPRHADTPDEPATHVPRLEQPTNRPVTVWLRHPTTGVEHHVLIGSEAWKRLTAIEATTIEGPTAA